MSMEWSHIAGDSEPPTAHPVGDPLVSNLPIPATTLIGRERAVREVLALVRDPAVRLVTLTGPGGIGKTRLALAVTHAVRAAVFVPLAPLAGSDLIATAILQTLGVEHRDARPNEQALRSVLRERDLLLVLDNFEHLLDGASLVSDLLATCPRLTVLATSRIRLGLSGEHIVPVEPLEAPDPTDLPALETVAAASGVRLFGERARAVHPAFALTDRNAAAIATICQRLDGLPLAIELAAARSNVLSPEALAARLEHRLELLTGGPRDAPECHRAMRAAIGWSVDLLGATERALWEALGVFVGGFTAEAAEAIGQCVEGGVPEPLDTLSALVDQGLLRSIANAEGEPRFTMLETAREYALEHLASGGMEAATRDAHAHHYVAFAQVAEPGLMGTEPDLWFHRVEADIANIRAALGWLRERGRMQAALELAGALAWFWTAPNYIAEGRAVYDGLIEDAGPEVAPSVLAKVQMAAGDLADWQADTARSIALHQRALASWRAAGDRGGIARSLRCLGSSAIDRFAFDEAITLLAEARRLSLDTGDAWTAAATTNLLGVALREQGAIEDASRWHEEALRRWQQIGDRSHMPTALIGLGWCELDLARDQQAWEAFEAAIAITGDAKPDWDASWSLVGFAALAARHGQPATAARLLAATARQRRQLGLSLRPPHQARFDRLTDEARATLGSAAFAHAWSEGEAMTVAEAMQAARATSIPGAAADDGLSPREREVLARLVEGASDQEIADALFITRRTASKHVAAILEKLGASNRTSAATIAHRRGLV
jgi:predicted ATPase/DNA-binding CsgD family transcriptional regulator